MGDTVWEVNEKRNIISEFTIESITIYPFSVQYNWKLVNGVYNNLTGFTDSELGITVFLDRKDAEAKLQELKTCENDK